MRRPRVYFHRFLSGQTPLGVFTNLGDHVDQWAVGGWYLCVHLGAWRVEVHQSIPARRLRARMLRAERGR